MCQAPVIWRGKRNERSSAPAETRMWKGSTATLKLASPAGPPYPARVDDPVLVVFTQTSTVRGVFPVGRLAVDATAIGPAEVPVVAGSVSPMIAPPVPRPVTEVYAASLALPDESAATLPLRSPSR